MIITQQTKFSIHALVDSGVEQNLISADLMEQLPLPIQRLEPPLPVMGITGHNIIHISQIVPNLQLFTSGNHQELGEFFVFPSPYPPLILGYPRVIKHNPVINWRERRIEAQSYFCMSNYLKSTVPMPCSKENLAENIDLSKVSPEYHDMAKFLTKLKPSLCHLIGRMTAP